MDGDGLPPETMQRRVDDAVWRALLERDVKSQGKRIDKLEAFRWWLLAGVSIAGCSSTGTLILFILSHPVKGP